jgi:probable phosphoglycerate mutase
VLLVRHGTTPTTGKVLPGRARGLHLADSGRAQADSVASRIAGWASADRSDDHAGAKQSGAKRSAARRSGDKGPRVAAVYASPLERARETAAPIAKALGLAVTVERGLLECDFGTWTGAGLRELAKDPAWVTVQRHPSGFRFPGGESFPAMQARIVDAIGAICARHRGEAVVAVSHADPIKAAVADAMGTPLDLFQRIVISPCSLTAISYAPTGPTVLAVNSTASLTEVGLS